MSKVTAICLTLIFSVTMFLHVNDRPVVEDIQEYYTLSQRGMVVTNVCGEEMCLFWQDFSPEDRKILQLMLRTP